MRTEDAPDSLVPYQEVRDFFHYRDNYVDELDVASEALAADIGIDGDGNAVATLELALAERFGIRVVRVLADAGLIRHYDPATKVLTLDRDLAEPTRAFQLATQLADLLLPTSATTCWRPPGSNRRLRATSPASACSITRPAHW
jgi:XRE family transcriptional regulator, fatty acid utilization regulator